MNTMQPHDAFHDTPSAKSWQVLGELELIAGPDADRTFSTWLAVILAPLELPADFLNKVMKSAQEVAARAMRNGMSFEHLHLLVFAPSTRSSNEQTWGFFRIEKVAAANANESPRDHAIEFYLYLEDNGMK